MQTRGLRVHSVLSGEGGLQTRGLRVYSVLSGKGGLQTQGLRVYSVLSGEGGLQTRGLCVHSVLSGEGACRPGDACLRTAPTPRAGPDVLRRMNHCACPDGPLEPNFVAPKPPQMLTLGIGSSCWLGSKE